ncbi:MAG: DUF2156 domain-containing protein [Clostridia bacterium]|nr:DUF2156 domain-containing protein [Clostridia bacterium]
MIDFRPIELEDAKVIKKYLEMEYSTGCEMAFGTLFIWRKPYNYKYAIIEDCLVIMSKNEDNPAGLRFPVGKGNKLIAAKKACDYMESIGEKPQFYGVTKNAVEFIKENSSEYEIQDMSAFSDYVYESEKLINLSGKKLHSKKNHLNQFKNTYNYEYCEIKSKDRDDIMSAYDGWGDFSDKYLEAERSAISEITENIEALGLKGAMLKVDGDITAFTFGERLNCDTAVIHIEKANAEIRGAYAAINQMFVANQWKEYKYINREDDCGIEGLKRAKLSYRPVFMVEKFKVIRR